ncbi:hypothetical protein [Faecalibacterium prausnitzii]|uniref:hypothetical protein n=1 Tax=Faecalibacterium prausnitzii TaxID=853 RepID=UPI003AAC7E43
MRPDDRHSHGACQHKFFTSAQWRQRTLLSMLPFVLQVSFRHGAKWGLFTGFVNSCLQMIMGFYPPPAFRLPLLPR